MDLEAYQSFGKHAITGVYLRQFRGHGKGMGQPGYPKQPIHPGWAADVDDAWEQKAPKGSRKIGHQSRRCTKGESV